ncbi:MAG TPA: two-component system response regulator [Verrucomicrobia bacterium]|nr:two-component system response regulator [Verrucomicrobiota bacterium]
MSITNPKILVADDSSTMRRILKMTLARCGFEDVTEATDGQDAVSQCKAQNFDCVLTDWNMPNMDGLELIVTLRGMPAYAKVPIMMITTEGAKDDVIEALTRGANAYIVKPFTPDTLKQKMSELLGS